MTGKLFVAFVFAMLAIPGIHALAGDQELDLVLVVRCCVEETIAKRAGTACSEDFCSKVQDDQMKAFQEAAAIRQKEYTKEELAVFAEHEEDEGANEYLELLAQGTVPTVELDPKDAESDENIQKEELPPAPPALARNDAEPDPEQNSLLSMASSITASTNKVNKNPFTATANKHPKGIINYKWSAGPLDAVVQGHITNAMTNYQVNTCIRFKHNPAAVLEFNPVTNGGSSTSGIGKNAAKMTVAKTNYPWHSADHELGHVIGQGHTFVRKWRWFYVKVDGAACRKYHTGQVNPAQGQCNAAYANSRLNRLDAAYTKQCGAKGVYNPLIAQKRLPKAYNPAVPADLNQCKVELCMNSQMYQYQVDNTFHNVGWYHYDSIMHYNFNQCMQPRKFMYRLQGSPPVRAGGPVQNDYDIINEEYKCKKAVIHCKVNGVDVPPITKYIHPDYSAQDIQQDMTVDCGLPAKACTIKRKTKVLRRLVNVVNANIPNNSKIYITC